MKFRPTGPLAVVAAAATFAFGLAFAQAPAPAPQAAAPTAPAVAVPPAPRPSQATAWLVMDYATGQTPAGENVDERVEPASLTKVMTSYVIARSEERRVG